LRNAGVCGQNKTINRYNIVNERIKEGADGKGMVKYMCSGSLASSTKTQTSKMVDCCGYPKHSGTILE
jgi:hypothetical protein